MREIGIVEKQRDNMGIRKAGENIKTWQEFKRENPQVAQAGMKMLLGGGLGYAFLATVRKDGAPRLHPVAVVFHEEHLYVMMPPSSPKCGDLVRDGRYAIQAFPPSPNENNEEFYLAGTAVRIEQARRRQELVEGANIHAEQDEILFELLLERVMYTRLEGKGTSDVHPVHKKWRADQSEKRKM